MCKISLSARRSMANLDVSLYLCIPAIFQRTSGMGSIHGGIGSGPDVTRISGKAHCYPDETLAYCEESRVVNTLARW